MGEGSSWARLPRGAKQISGPEYDEFIAWKEKKEAKKAGDAISTQGQLLTRPEFIETLDDNKRKKLEKEETTAANKKQRQEKNEQKIIEEAEKKKKLSDRLNSESQVRELLQWADGWTSRSGFNIAADTKKFIAKHKDFLSEKDGYAPALKADDAILFLEGVLEEGGVEAFETEEYI